ncbi:histidine phosphatase family protein [Saccharibacillus alkalitolerans]|uniref:Histidine phosphatase family protein n=1 Tax=Saccharibacillus alkalitolerans TaxID=2705290 RepID=A0ABX0FAF9_9BACL|nr:histidine phosphatase family protein [Saccharibacillus alkalitolerans]NGZ76959.1 histidine phosphatase family protein [Saccharibacillus alkalitolerans]
MNIYLVRHGMDEEGYRGGWSRRGLAEEGVAQSRRLGDHLRDHSETYGIRTLLASDLPRAAETAREIGQKTGLGCVYSEEWREMNNGELAGMPNPEAENKYPGLYFNTLGMDTPYPGGESPAHFQARICRAFGKLCAGIESGGTEANVLLVTHGGVINVLYYHLNGREWTNRAAFYPIAQTGMHTVAKTDEGWKMISENALPHG